MAQRLDVPDWREWHNARPSSAEPIRHSGHPATGNELPGNPDGTGAGDGEIGPPRVHGVRATGDELPGNP